MKPKITLLTLAAACLAAYWSSTSTSTQAASLGDEAAPLAIATWVKGDAVDLAANKGKKVHVVEFWATWCGPCRTSIPHLTELQKKFKDKDVIFVGVSDEKVDVVKKFVDNMGDKMDYVVAVDKDRKTSDGYMKAYGINGIPHAFVVGKDGQVIWQGHPMAGLEEALSEIVAGKYDIATARKQGEARELIEKYWGLLMEDKDPAAQAELEKKIADLGDAASTALPGGKFDPKALRKQAKFNKLMTEYQREAGGSADETKLADLAKQIGEVAPEGFNVAQVREDMAFDGIARNYMKLAMAKTKSDKLAEVGQKLAEAKTSNAQMLNGIAWTILTDEQIQQRDKALALTLAKKAVGMQPKEPAILDTYARALFDNGKLDEAVKTEKEAVGLCTDDSLREELTKSLKEFESKLAGSK